MIPKIALYENVLMKISSKVPYTFVEQSAQIILKFLELLLRPMHLFDSPLSMLT